jgi:hypothetical protein
MEIRPVSSVVGRPAVAPFPAEAATPCSMVPAGVATPAVVAAAARR